MKKILIAVDGSGDSDKALAQGVKLAKRCGSDVVLVAVQRGIDELEFYLPGLLDKEELKNKFESVGQGLLKDSKESLKKNGVTNVKAVLKLGKPADKILEAAEEEGADLIVVGCRGKHRSKLLMGSVSKELSERSKVSVLIAR